MIGIQLNKNSTFIKFDLKKESVERINENDEIANYVSIIKKNANLLNFLISDILDFSQMKKGVLRTNP
jgi:hypothetical protein